MRKLLIAVATTVALGLLFALLTGASVGPRRITTADIVDGAVSAAKIGTGAVTTTKLAASAVTAAAISVDTLDYAQLQDTLDLDATTTTNFGASNNVLNLNSTGDLLIQDNAVTFVTFSDAGVTTVDGTLTCNAAVNVGDGGDLVAVNGSGWGCTGAGVCTGVESLATDDNDTTFALNIPVTGVDAGAHTVSLQVDGNIGVSVAATGDGAGSVGVRTVNVGVSAGADVVHVGDANALLDLTDANWSISDAGVSAFTGGSYTGAVTLNTAGGVDAVADEVGIDRSAAGATTFNIQNSGAGAMTLQVDGNTAWHAGNDGAASTLDADLLDGNSSAFYTDMANASAGTLAVNRGGTGNAAYAIGDMLYASAATTLTRLAAVAAGSALISGGVGVAPLWGVPATATALAADPANCGANTFANASAANGDLSCVAIAATNLPAAAADLGAADVNVNLGNTNAAFDTNLTIDGALTAAEGLVGNASTATALAADGADCGAGSAAAGVNASGAASGCFDAEEEANLGTTIIGDNAGGVGEMLVATGVSGASWAAMSGDVTSVSGAGVVVVGNAATADALTANPAACGAGTFADDIAADGTLTCNAVTSADITDGEIATGDLSTALTVKCVASLDFAAVVEPAASVLAAQTCVGVAAGWACTIAPADGALPANTSMVMAHGDGAGTIAAALLSVGADSGEPVAENYNVRCWAP